MGEYPLQLLLRSKVICRQAQPACGLECKLRAALPLTVPVDIQTGMLTCVLPLSLQARMPTGTTQLALQASCGLRTRHGPGTLCSSSGSQASI